MAELSPFTNSNRSDSVIIVTFLLLFSDGRCTLSYYYIVIGATECNFVDPIAI